VFHSLRGDAIDEMRDADVEGRAGACSPDTSSATYTTSTASAPSRQAVQYLANLPLQEGINWDVFQGTGFRCDGQAPPLARPAPQKEVEG
jgi:hypothetical protein